MTPVIGHGIAHRSSGKEKENLTTGRLPKANEVGRQQGMTTGHLPAVQPKAAHGDPGRTLSVVTVMPSGEQ